MDRWDGRSRDSAEIWTLNRIWNNFNLFTGSLFADVNRLQGRRPPYEYSAMIGDSMMRLISILPSEGEGEGDSQITCEINYHARLMCPDYEALSYTWGDTPSFKTILCNDRELRVTSNCEAALRALRSRDSMLPVWIDAICINQADIAERNEQVALMGTIYRQAKRTVVFLGKHYSTKWTPDQHIAQDYSEVDEALQGSTFSRKLAAALLQDCKDSCDWFNRTWVIQEVLLSREVVVLTKSGGISWDSFDNPERMDPNSLHTSILGQKTQLVSQYAKGSRGYHLRLSHWKLLDVLKDTRTSQCNDPRDKLFAMLSLFESPLPKLIRADYSKNLKQVYSDLVWSLIDYDVPEVLHLAGAKQAGDSLPSWVVDWRNEGSEDKFADSCSCHAGFQQGEKRLIAKRRGDTLVLRGQVVENIKTITEDTDEEYEGEYIARRCPGSETKSEAAHRWHRSSFRCFRTEAGLRGIGPDTIHQGDSVCVFIGCRMPFVVRPDGVRWNLVGACFVGGRMRGEAVIGADWTAVDSDKPVSPLVDFKIC